MITKEKIIEKLKSGEIRFPPLNLRFVESGPLVGSDLFDAAVDAVWEDHMFWFVVFFSVSSTP